MANPLYGETDDDRDMMAGLGESETDELEGIEDNQDELLDDFLEDMQEPL